MLQNIGLLTRFGSIEVFKRTKAHLIFMKEQIWRPTKHDISRLEMFRGFFLIWIVVIRNIDLELNGLLERRAKGTVCR